MYVVVGVSDTSNDVSDASLLSLVTSHIPTHNTSLHYNKLLFILMIYALGSGYPVAFALPGSAIVTILLAGFFGLVVEGDSGAYFIQDGPVEWLTAGVTNFRGIYWEVERDTCLTYQR